MIDYALRRRFSFFEMEPGFNSEEMLFMELIHFTRGARRYLHGEGSRPEGPAFPCGPDSPPGRPPRRPHGHRSPVFARERILTLLLDHETRQDAAAETAGPADEAPAAGKAEDVGAGLRQKQLMEEMRINASTMSEFIGHLETDGYVSRNLGKRKAEGFRYSYDVQGTGMYGEAYVIKEDTTIYYQSTVSGRRPRSSM